MIVQTDGINPECLMLGTQVGHGRAIQTAHWKANVWAPARALSYTIRDFRYTDYHGRPDENGAYSRFSVTYYTAASEGAFIIAPANKRHKDGARNLTVSSDMMPSVI